MMPPVVQGHVQVTTLAGRASLTIHQEVTAFGRIVGCLPLLTVMVEPAGVLDLADQLTRAAVPPPPVRSPTSRRIRIRRDARTRRWGLSCPECFPLGAWMCHTQAVTAAERHLAAEHPRFPDAQSSPVPTDPSPDQEPR